MEPIFFSKPTRYSHPFSDPSSNSSPVFRNPETYLQLHSSPSSEINSLRDLFLNTAADFRNRPFLGTKVNDSYRWRNYGEAHEFAEVWGSGLLEKDLVPLKKEYKSYEVRFLGICSKNREEYILADLACVFYGITTVPIYDTLGVQGVSFILKQTGLKTMVVSGEMLDKLIKENLFGEVQTIIALDVISPSQRTEIEKRKLKIIPFTEVLSKQLPLPYPKINSRSLYVFSYTSGTTGDPKGAMMTHGNFLSMTAAAAHIFPVISEEDSYISYLPFAHVFERIVFWFSVYKGAGVGFYNGDVLKLKNDLEVLRPTFMPIVPRLLNRLCSVMKEGIAALTGCKRGLANRAVNTKMFNLKNNNDVKHCLWDALIFKKMRNALGGRLKFMAIGSAPTSPDVLNFMKIALSIPIAEGYGQTESSGASFVMHLDDLSGSGYVGGILINNEFKIVDVPEMNYFASNKSREQGTALRKIRGECCIRGPGVFEGYYKDEAKTKEAIDGEGWLHTGDVVEMMENGGIKVIDRLKNIFKLAQG